MNPNASLKSLNTNFRKMASRSINSIQPGRPARAALRASPASFCGMVHPFGPARGPRKRTRKILTWFQTIAAKIADQVYRQRGFMGWSLNIGSIAGTAVRIHITFLLFLIWIFGASYATGGLDAAWRGLIFMI